MIYYIIDVRFPHAYRRSAELNVRSGDVKFEDFETDILYHFVYPGESIRTIVRDTKKNILEAKWGYYSVDMIRLCGHGDSGQLQLGEGLTESNADQFSELAVCMKPDYQRIGVEIHGCGVASDTSVLGASSTINNPICVPGSSQNGDRGRNFLKKLAKAIGRHVKGGLNCQYVLDRYDDWKFEGPTITATPWGDSWLR
jgi:hypothetical protein